MGIDEDLLAAEQIARQHHALRMRLVDVRLIKQSC